jgi:hypothetical protein
MNMPDEFDESGRSAYDRYMDARLTKLEEFAERTTDRLNAIAEDIAAIKVSLTFCATKADLANFATKDDLAKCATKDDLAKCATKDDLAKCATKEDLAKCATKEDIAVLRSEMHELNSNMYRHFNQLTWRFLTFTTGVASALVAATYFVARYVH